MTTGKVASRTFCAALTFRLVVPLLALAATCLAGVPARAEMVSIASTPRTKAINLRAELFRPKGPGRFPAVVLMHGCGGWQPAVLDALHTHALLFLDSGYVVLNVDSFGPRGNSGGAVCESDAALVKALEYRTHDAFDALRYLVSHDFVDPENVFLMGQSNGGSVAINAAKASGTPRFRAVAAYYPWCGSLGSSTVKLNSHLIIFSGAQDDWTPARECRNRVTTGKTLKVVEYAGAAHSFDLSIPPQRYLGKLVGFDKAATDDSRKKMLTFFDEVRLAGSGRQLVVAETVDADQGSDIGNGSRSTAKAASDADFWERDSSNSRPSRAMP